jgi:hypothetical protein
MLGTGDRQSRVAAPISSATSRLTRGSTTLAYGIYSVESLAAYEQYRTRLAADPLGRENYEFAKRERFLLREDRTFLKLASAPHAPLVKR